MNWNKLKEWFYGWCPRETLFSRLHFVPKDEKIGIKLDWKRVVIVYGIAFALVSLSLVMVPSYASEAETMVHMETVDQVWRRTEENAVNFRASPLSKVLVTYRLKMWWLLDTDGSVERFTRMVLEVYSNGIHVTDVTMDIEWVIAHAGGDYGPILIPPETLKVGKNTVTVLMSFNSTASEPPTRPDMFHFVVELFINTDNSKLAALLMVLFVPISIILARKRGT